jgi:hypothetical protein
MIVKKIPARPVGRNAAVERAAQARNLVDYLRLPEKDSPEKAYMVAYMLEAKLGDTIGERLFHVGGRGFVSETPAGQRAEMIAVAQAAKRSPNPVDHWLLSWRKDELPTPEQIDEVAALFMEHLGVGDQPCIYACHGDTHNRHLHVALNRFDAVRQRMIEINDGFNLEAAHQAVALIVERFGWQAEADARYEVVNGRPVMTASARAKQAEGARPIRPEAAAFESRTGYRSAQRIAQEEALPIIAAAKSWAEVHAQLGARGITYDLKGTNGAVLVVEGEAVRASEVHRSITRTPLERQGRLGPFQQRDAGVEVKSRDDVDDRLPGAFRADEYRRQRDAWDRWRQAERDRLSRERERQARAQMPTEIARAALLARQPSKLVVKPERPPPNLESWYYAEGEGLFAERWRHRRHVTPFPAICGELAQDAAQPLFVGDYLPFDCADGVRYARGEKQPTAFLDRGDRIEVMSQEDDALVTAMRLGVLKFGGRISLAGSPEFRERAYALAQTHGLGGFLTDPDHVNRRVADERPRPEPTRPVATRPATPVVPGFDGEAGPGRREVGNQGPLRQAARVSAGGTRPVGEGAIRNRRSFGPADGRAVSDAAPLLARDNRRADHAADRHGSSVATGAAGGKPSRSLPTKPDGALARQAQASKNSGRPVSSKGPSPAPEDWPPGSHPTRQGTGRD